MNKKIYAVVTILVIALFTVTGCGKTAKSWAYSHDPQTEILSLADNGEAVYKGSNYTYTKDDSFITLKGNDGSEQKLRYVPDDKDENKMVLYERSEYRYQGEDGPDSVIGVWFQDNGRSNFQFTEKGTFAEDNVFYGHFIVDEKEGTIKLMYDEPLEDTILYYTIDGNIMIIDYPWPLVKTGSGEAVVDQGTIK